MRSIMDISGVQIVPCPTRESCRRLNTSDRIILSIYQSIYLSIHSGLISICNVSAYMQHRGLLQQQNAEYRTIATHYCIKYRLSCESPSKQGQNKDDGIEAPSSPLSMHAHMHAYRFFPEPIFRAMAADRSICLHIYTCIRKSIRRSACISVHVYVNLFVDLSSGKKSFLFPASAP
jgi:hypothetical protein